MTNVCLLAGIATTKLSIIFYQSLYTLSPKFGLFRGGCEELKKI